MSAGIAAEQAADKPAGSSADMQAADKLAETEPAEADTAAVQAAGMQAAQAAGMQVVPDRGPERVWDQERAAADIEAGNYCCYPS